MVDAGRISAETKNIIQEKNLFYAPLYRVMDSGHPELSGVGKKTIDNLHNPIKQLKGSSRDIISPTESLLKNTYSMINVAERNRVGDALIKLSKEEGMGDILEQIPFPQKPIEIGTIDGLKQLGDTLEFSRLNSRV